MKTEKQVRTWWLKNNKGQVSNLGKDGFRYGDTEVSMWPDCVKDYSDFHDAIKVIAFDDHQEIVKGLEARINRLRLVLQKIADEDFRGNRPSGSVKAYQALKDDEAGNG